MVHNYVEFAHTEKFVFTHRMENKSESKKNTGNLSGLRIEQVSGSVENAADGIYNSQEYKCWNISVLVLLSMHQYTVVYEHHLVVC